MVLLSSQHHQECSRTLHTNRATKQRWCIDEDLKVKKMDTTTLFSVSGIPSLQEKRFEIGNQVFLVSKHGIAVRTEILCEKEYKRTTMKGGEAIHLHYEGSFNLHGKLLEVSAISKTSYGPAGDRKRLDVLFDQEVIGNYSALISYMGGGSNGKWPCIKTKDWILTFTFTSTGFNSKKNLLLIEYFKVIIPDHLSASTTNKRKSISSTDLPADFMDEEYSFEELEKHKLIHWLIPVTDPASNKLIGRLSCCSYPGYERYTKSYYGDYTKIKEITKRLKEIDSLYNEIKIFIKNPREKESFIGRALNSDCIVNIELETDGGTERYSLEGDASINYTV